MAGKEELSGGYFYDLASHQLDYLDLIFGEITEAHGTTAKWPTVRCGRYGRWQVVAQLGVKGRGHWEFAASVKENYTIEIWARKVQSAFLPSFYTHRLVWCLWREDLCEENLTISSFI